MKTINITELCEIQVGKTPSRNESSYWGKGSLWLSIADMNQGLFLEKTKETITDKAVQETKIKIVPAGTILFSFKLSIGKVGITQVPMYTNEAIAAFIIKDYSKLDTKYLYYILKGTDHTIGSKRAVMGKTLNKEMLKKIEIPVPSLEEQKRIVFELDAADAIRQKRKQAISLLDDYLKAVFFEMFGDPATNPKGWIQTSLGETCYSIKDGPHVSPNYVENGVPFISVNNIIRGWDLSNVKYISEVDHKEFIKKSKPEKGDVLYTKGGTTGFAKYVDLDIEFSNWVHLAVLKFDRNRVNGIFLEQMLNTDFCYRQSQAYTRGIANRDLVLGQMKKIKIYLPPFEMQKKFAHIVQKTEYLQKSMLIQSKELDTNFKALMQETFNQNS